jgi:hypothetical protein
MSTEELASLLGMLFTYRIELNHSPVMLYNMGIQACLKLMHNYREAILVYMN